VTKERVLRVPRCAELAAAGRDVLLRDAGHQRRLQPAVPDGQGEPKQRGCVCACVGARAMVRCAVRFTVAAEQGERSCMCEYACLQGCTAKLQGDLPCDG
jgi:hypothetical protein